MPKSGRWIGKYALLSLMLLFFTGCAHDRVGGIDMVSRDVAAIERIADNHDLSELSDFEGVALLSLGKAGMGGFGATGWSASVFVKDPVRKEYGPPSFLNAAGLTVGLGYLGVNNTDCLLLFRNRQDAIEFANKSVNFHFSNEASFLFWGRKKMTIPDAKSFSDGGGLSLGLVELELLFGWRPDVLHREVYDGASVNEILSGKVAIPDDLKSSLARLNLLMKRTQTDQKGS